MLDKVKRNFELIADTVHQKIPDSSPDELMVLTKVNRSVFLHYGTWLIWTEYRDLYRTGGLKATINHFLDQMDKQSAKNVDLDEVLERLANDKQKKN